MCPVSASPPANFSDVFLFEMPSCDATPSHLSRMAFAIYSLGLLFLIQAGLIQNSFPRSCISHFDTLITCQPLLFFLRKEVIQPHLPIRLPCYDFTPVIEPAFGSSLLAVGSLTSGITNSHGGTGGVYKARERIHRDILIRDY